MLFPFLTETLAAVYTTASVFLSVQAILNISLKQKTPFLPIPSLFSALRIRIVCSAGAENSSLARRSDGQICESA